MGVLCVGWGVVEGEHGEGGEEAPVGGEVGGECGALVDVAVGVVEVFGGVDEECVEGGVAEVEFGGGHGGHGEVPTPAAVPLPDAHDFAEGVVHDGGIDAEAGLCAVGAEDGRVLVGPFGVGVGHAFLEEIEAVFLGEG